MILSEELAKVTGIRGIIHHETCTVIEFAGGGCRPATELEERLLNLLIERTGK